MAVGSVGLYDSMTIAPSPDLKPAQSCRPGEGPALVPATARLRQQPRGRPATWPQVAEQVYCRGLTNGQEYSPIFLIWL